MIGDPGSWELRRRSQRGTETGAAFLLFCHLERRLLRSPGQNLQDTTNQSMLCSAKVLSISSKAARVDL